MGIPSHRALDLTGLHAYAQQSVAAGETVHFRTSSSTPYQLSVCRLAGVVDDQASDVVLHRFDEAPAQLQPIHPGSYVHVEVGLPATNEIRAITLECWLRPWRLASWQGVITQYDYSEACGIGLFVGEQGRATLYLGDGGKYNESRMFVGTPLNHRRWNHLAGTWDGKQATLWINGRKSGVWECAGPVKPANTPLRLGAYGDHGAASNFLDGDLAVPTIYDRALTAEEIKERIDARGLTPPTAEGVIACWPLAEENGERIADIGVGKREGKIINHAAWMIGGPSFNGDTIGRYDETYDPASDENRGHGLRFASDDLYDCRWETTHEWKIPDDATSGLYVGRYDYHINGQPYQYHVTFNVRRPERRAKSPILVLLSSSTWLAYNAAPFPTAVRGLHGIGTEGMRSCHGEAPAYSCYRDHRHGQPTYYLGLRMPWPAAAPDALYIGNYSHLMRGELYLHRWLDGVYGDHGGYEYDVVTDYDLHRDPAMLEGYKTLYINGHSEYWSAEAYTGVDRFLSAGGTVIALSGNTMFWRTSFSEDGGVMECRKFDPRIGGRGGATVGELYHSDDKRRGSLMREAGYPAWKCIGLECCGWNGGFDGAYQVDLPEHFLFTEPENVALAKGEAIARGAISHEWDVRLATLKKMTRNIPTDAVLPDEPEGITTLARGVRGGGGTLDYFTNGAPAIGGVCAELIYWERPTGGRVLHAGAIAAGWALSNDAKWQTMMRNVLHHFGIESKPA